MHTLAGTDGCRWRRGLAQSALALALLALAACASGSKVRGHLSANDVESLMHRGVIAELFAAHDGFFVTTDSGEVFTADPPAMEKIAEYMAHREAIGKPVDYQME